MLACTLLQSQRDALRGNELSAVATASIARKKEASSSDEHILLSDSWACPMGASLSMFEFV